jgi:hypothetical protein
MILPEFKNKTGKKNITENNRYSTSKKISSKNLKKKYITLKRNHSQNELPPINQNSDVASKIKKSSLKKSISYLYKSLFPDEKNSMEEFLNNFSYNKHLNKPNWKYTFSPLKEEEKIKIDLMSRNKIMNHYNKMKKPCFIKKEFKRKPRMIQIIEDNNLYKNRLYDYPLDNEFNLTNRKRSIELEFKNVNQEADEYEEEFDNEDLNDNYYFSQNNNKNKIHFSNIYRGTIYPFMNGKILLSPIKSLLIKDGDNQKYDRNDFNRININQYRIESIEEEV